jgi:hypothetical protein
MEALRTSKEVAFEASKTFLVPKALTAIAAVALMVE